MTSTDKSTVELPRDCEDEAAELFARKRTGNWTPDDQELLEGRLARDGNFADAFRRVEQSWVAVGKHAASPELMVLREQAIGRARRASARRWLRDDQKRHRLRIAAAIIGISIALATAIQLSPFGYRSGVYATDIGEQRVIELDDRSRIALDAKTRLRVHFSDNARTIQLLEGVAEFAVARDPNRPFKVEAGERTIVAVGTVFTVGYIDREVRVTLLEGKVAVTDDTASPHRQSGAVSQSAGGSAIVELAAGEELHVRHDGSTTVNPKADLDAATAWRQGKVIFRDEPLGEAVRRLNRYSRLQLEIEDSALAALRVTGVFDAGDTAAFAEAVQSYLPVVADYSDSDTIHLRMR
jgi:transmembrane sensor